MDEEELGGRIFFSNVGRSMEVEDELRLTSVGVDVGSSTSHLAFSTIVLERLDTRYIVVERTLLHESEVLLTPYRNAGDEIDADALGEFITAQYAAAGLTPDKVDTGALILTGVAVRRRNARAIGEAISAQTGKFVVVSAGDGLETTLAAWGSGAVARSEQLGQAVLNIDIGGGTSKLARCESGAITALTAIDVGARVVAFDQDRRIVRVEEAGRHFGKEAGVNVELGAQLSEADAQKLVVVMADHLLKAIRGGEMGAQTTALHRLPSLPELPLPAVVTVSGGVSEFLYADGPEIFSDLGPQLALELRRRLEQWGPALERPRQGIRATVIGASQYTVQVSGSTIFVEPMSSLPLRNVPVIKPELELGEEIDSDKQAALIGEARFRLNLTGQDAAIALCYEWRGSASYRRLDQFCRGILAGLRDVVEVGHPLVLVGDGDVGGLVGMHFLEFLGVRNVVSIDGIDLDEFDFIDIGELLETSGAVPVVIKSLVFPGAGLGTDGANTRADPA